LFGYFTSLVDAYTKCLMPNKDEVEKLKKHLQEVKKKLLQMMPMVQGMNQQQKP